MNSPLTTTAPDRRSLVRKIARLSAVLEMDGAAPLSVRTVEVSSGGAALSCPLNLKPGGRCLVRIALPARPPLPMLAVRASIIYSVLSQRDGGFRVGIQFQALSQAEESRLQTFLNA
jgi:c-di-GMP-binding flagellar brake protein YcgR